MELPEHTGIRVLSNLPICHRNRGVMLRVSNNAWLPCVFSVFSPLACQILETRLPLCIRLVPFEKQSCVRARMFLVSAGRIKGELR